MSFSFNEEQRLLQESADRFVQNEYDFETRRKISESPDGISRDNWAKFAELGWLALTIPEEYGGLEWGMTDVAVLMEAFGRGLVVEPFLPTAVIGSSILVDAGSDAQKSDLLPKLAEGGLILSLAHVEPGARYHLPSVATEAKASGDAYALSGHKAVVFNADIADKLIVSARTSGNRRDKDGITLFLVDRDADGVTLRSYATQDGLRAAEVHLENVLVGADAVIGEVGNGLAVVEAAADKASIALSAEAAGAMQALVEATTEYLKTRTQFGAAIGRNQVLQHFLVDMSNAHQLSRALTYRAAGQMEGTDPVERGKAASAAKSQAGQAGRLVGEHAVQMHGGMGMTDELSVGHYFKRLSMIDTMFGDSAYHLKRFADLS